MHVTDAMQWDRLYLTPGLRTELIHSVLEDRLTQVKAGASNQILLPGVGAFVSLYKEKDKSFGLLAGVHRGFSPTPPGDASGKPESSVNYEVGARLSSKRLRAEVIGFYNDYSNFTDVCTFSTGCANANIDRKFDAGSARIRGFEAFLDGDVPLFDGWALPFHASYTITQAQFQTSFTSQDPVFGRVKAGDEIPYVPIHQLSANAGIEGKRFSLNLGLTHVGTMREKPGQGIVRQEDLTDASYVVDASARYKATTWLSLYVHGRNLLDQVYITSRRPFGARPGAPFTLISGLEFRM
jgi:Fe(3+) dicitrate transport protein